MFLNKRTFSSTQITKLSKFQFLSKFRHAPDEGLSNLNHSGYLHHSFAYKKPSELYFDLVKHRKIDINQNQQHIVKKLDQLHFKIRDYTQKLDNKLNLMHSHRLQQIKQKYFSHLFSKTLFGNLNSPRGAYIYGPPGSGKTFLMDLFLQSFPMLQWKKRVHFHKFMLDVHDQMHKLGSKSNENQQNAVDPLIEVATRIRKETILLCFDEFQVTDIVDAVILKRLFTQLFEQGVVVLATSNRAPDELYLGGLQRDQIFLPFIDLLNQKCETLHLDSDCDFRESGTRLRETYFYPINDRMTDLINQAFAKVTEHRSKLDIHPLQLNLLANRVLDVPESYKGVCRFDFDQLCSRPLGAADFNALATCFDTIFIYNVPKMSLEHRDRLKRFITLIDELYQQKVRLVILAETRFYDLFTVSETDLKLHHDEVFAWDRCCSRLFEMQTKEYLDESAALVEEKARNREKNMSKDS